MPNEYKLRQEIFHRLENTDDWLDLHEYEIVNYGHDYGRLVNDIVDYFLEPIPVLKFPAKSYSVAIIYAHLLQHYFNVPMMEALCDPDLLFNNDKFFQPYRKNTWFIYDDAIEEIDRMGAFGCTDEFNQDLPQVRTTVDYFKREFYLIPNPYFDNTDLS